MKFHFIQTHGKEFSIQTMCKIFHVSRAGFYAWCKRPDGILCSMSRKGDCWDNTAMESFFHTLKTECVYHERYQTREEAKISVFDFIEVFYNRQRKHSYLGYKSPEQYEMLAMT